VNTVQIDEAIHSKDWLEFECPGQREKTFTFRLRVLGLEPAENFEDVNKVDLSRLKPDGIFWILEVEVVNTDKEPLKGDYIRRSLSLIDSDGSRFDASLNISLVLDRMRSSRFSSVPLPPKIIVSASIAFFLPDQEPCYSLACCKGRIQ